MKFNHLPEKQGLYDPACEHDACGVGFVCDIKGRTSNTIVRKGLEVLERMVHRGAVGADPRTGDGAGILLQMPDAFMRKVAAECGMELPAAGAYGTGLVFLPVDPKENAFCRKTIEDTAVKFGQRVLGWRKVPVDNEVIGETARKSEPVVEQVFIVAGNNADDAGSFERRLYVIRKVAENIVRSSDLKQKTFFYVVSLSCRTFTYKGLLMPEQVGSFFRDLQDTQVSSALALVHSRYSTNTFPTWDLAQPFRYIAHNGEINTLRGNINWMKAKENVLASDLFTKEELDAVKPIIVPNGSDSATIDNVFELLVLAGRSLPHAMMMLIPSAWENNDELDGDLKAFYKYHAAFMEPWDGPAAMAFTDGTRIGALLDRNGLRPARYIVTKDDFVVLASELGVLDIPAADIKISGRLEPGKIFLIDTAEKRIITDDEIKKAMAGSRPYRAWIEEHMLDLDTLPSAAVPDKRPDDILTAMKAFGYSREDLKILIKPMAETGQEPTGSMGNDVPHACLSRNPQLLYTYFKQLFAQVTNPPIDPIREEIVMSLQSFVGAKKNILDETPEHCRTVRVEDPVLSDEELERLCALTGKGMAAGRIPILFNAADAGHLTAALDRICDEAARAVAKGVSFIVLTDRGVDRDHAALPALLAVGAVHQHLVRLSVRSQTSIILESAEPREVHHFAVLFGYGADCINPYLAYQVVKWMISDGMVEADEKTALKNYRKAVEKGVKKVLSKMGISTLQSYRGAQIFEALGVHDEVVARCFTGTASRIGGVTFADIAGETVARHRDAYPERCVPGAQLLKTGGYYHWKKDGEVHLWNTRSIAALQDATRLNDYNRYLEFAGMINDQSQQPVTLRGALRFKKTAPISLDQVEPVENIYRRFVTGAMSFGSISRGAHETLAIAMNRLKGQSNTGEGGEDPARFVPLPNGDSKRSAIKQVASGRFGVTTNYLVNADEIQIKIAQGAKPGEGGQLPGHKVSVTIAATRYTTPGVTLISPPPHHDIYSIEDLKQLIYDLKNTNPAARISVKLVSEIGVGTVAAGVAKGHADMILISGGDGGTGASPLSSIKHAGLPWELGLSETHQTLVLNDLRSRVRLQTDGQLRTGRDVAIAAMLGAEEYGFCTAALIVMGCVMLRHCHLNNCSVGVATQDPILERRFHGRVDWVTNYMAFIARELRQVMADLGVRTVDELIGRTDLLEMNTDILPEKSRHLDFSRILFRPEVSDGETVFRSRMQDHEIDDVLDRTLIAKAAAALDRAEPVKIVSSIGNVNRSAGAMLSGEICRRYGNDGLPDNTVHCVFKGVSGQSFGAWLAQGVTFELEGLANDYVGKGMSGGRIVIYPDKESDYAAQDNVIIGNTTFYGAIRGEAFIRGRAGERFCIRNSGVNAVIEGVGDHGCEYMTGGRVVILGTTGRNFGAGMSGGIAYVYDEDGMFESRCNFSMIEIDTMDDDDVEAIRALLSDHARYTGSPKAQLVLDSFSDELKKFRKVMPLEYKRILEQKKLEEKMGVADSV